ncbi:tRNA pseudouridine(55) synthase TruB [Salinibacterium sp. UTAS2018]|uniref:tRNA pseudouridine(55) synthase TruB n=1 Tax=Salinibacterium sp. UTAS2018 TaxID=2508880 RepID=UPI00100940EF|nr:tRNA pseudouridine(55) synthase TruB [Salinibacterium sp. UTAS2018]QAV69065.1 tRNA pseudouridine(55) synthase TruB [Salinibacterium sp. UTAS2018]
MAKPPRNPASGILFVDKPQGITSHGVVSRARKAIGTRKIGHAGTLDPMATGLLVLGANNATRLLTYLVGLDKQYTATIRLGASSNTDDAEGELSEPADAATLAAVTDDAIAQAVAALTGAISQRPSSVSAIKVDGRRAYTLARAGEEVVLAERAVTVSAFDVLTITRGEFIDLNVLVDCSSGTYIRALARDVGEALNVGGHLTVLRRTKVGPFSVENASALDSDLETQLVAPATVAAQLFETVQLDAQQSKDLSDGKRIALAPQAATPIAALAPDGRLQGLIQIVDGRAHVLSNFPRDAQPLQQQQAAALEGDTVSEEGTPNNG